MATPTAWVGTRSTRFVRLAEVWMFSALSRWSRSGGFARFGLSRSSWRALSRSSLTVAV